MRRYLIALLGVVTLAALNPVVDTVANLLGDHPLPVIAAAVCVFGMWTVIVERELT